MPSSREKKKSTPDTSFADLDNMSKVRTFWDHTTMEPDDFREFVCKILKKDMLDVFNDFTDKFVLKVMDDLVKQAKKLEPDCGIVAEKNYEIFKANPKSSEIISQFVDALAGFHRDETLALELLLNFVRSVLRNDYIRSISSAQGVDLRPGVTARIWKNAFLKYFPGEENE